MAEKAFEGLKPRNIWTVQETPLCGARCEYCANFGKSRDALIACGMKGIPCNHAESIEVLGVHLEKTVKMLHHA